jgi:hypothetical protein
MMVLAKWQKYGKKKIGRSVRKPHNPPARRRSAPNEPLMALAVPTAATTSTLLAVNP